MRNAALLSVGILLILLQGRVLSFAQGMFDLPGLTPSLILPLIIFLGVNEHSMVRGSLISFGLGYANDLLASAPVGLFAFVYVAVWWLARVAGIRLTAQTHITKAVLSFAFCIVESIIVITLLAIFGSDAQKPVEMVRIVLPRAAATAVLAPLVFGVVQKVHYSPFATERNESVQ